MRLKLICCEILFREVSLLMANSPHLCDPVFLPKGLHDLGADKMMPRLQEHLDAVPEGYDAVLLGYALCNNGIVGLTARRCPVVIPRAHDCITLFMGSRRRYREYFEAHPGTYYRTTGWTERNDATGAGEPTISQKLGLFLQYEELVRKYGEENAQYVMETLGDATANYNRLTFIRMGLECEAPFRRQAEEEARTKGWTFEEVSGSFELLRKLVNGPWDDDFLVLQPGESVKASYDEGVVKTCPGCAG